MNPTEFIDEFIKNSLDNDFLTAIGEDPNEEREDEKQFLLSYDEEDPKPSRLRRGTTRCDFSTTSLSKFDEFYNYLLSCGYETMKSNQRFPYKVHVFKLTEIEADWLIEKFYGNRRLVSKQENNTAA